MENYSSDRKIKYCAGCGDYSILAAMKKTFAKLDLNKKDTVVVSGIGCSSRTPYYLSTWGFNTIHGRGGAIASGIKIANPMLSVWQCTGDGDCLAIGGNHFMHEVRRNIDINMLIFNNKIYGMTKGQYSPCSPKGQITKTSPYGSIEEPVNIGELCLASKGTFFARTLDKELKLTCDLMEKSYQHKGTSVLECLTNCVIWNDGAHKDKTYFVVNDGEEITFEKDGIKYGVLLNLSGNSDIIKYDELDVRPTIYDSRNKMMADILLRDFSDGNYIALGLIYQSNRQTYEDELYTQMKH